LFEDNAEYGLGMFSAMKHRRDRLINAVQDYVHTMELKDASIKSTSEIQIVSLFMDWLEVRDDKSDKCTLLYDKLKPLFKELLPTDDNKPDVVFNGSSLISRIWSDRDMFPKLSQWIVGGDGWAYDIGFGGLDHVEAFEANDVNVLVVDTEMYSNTGGQMSKATPAGASVKFAMGGKQQRKKNIGEIFMTYEHVYVASVSLANQAQVLQAFLEADRHNGPSFIVAYSPCVQQGVRPRGMDDMVEESRLAVDSGYWPLYRYNPSLMLHEQKNPFILDSKKLRKEVASFLARESRFLNLKKAHPEIAADLFAKMNTDVQHRMEHLNQLAAGYKAFDHEDHATVQVLFASETGTAARVARDFADACVLSHGADAMDDVDVTVDLEGSTTIFFVATCGQGAMPHNGKGFYKALCARTEPFREGTQFAVFGLGDSSYYFFCEAAKKIETRMMELGATPLLALGTGDDSAEEGLEQGLHDWLDTVWPALHVERPAEVPHILPAKVEWSPKALLRPQDEEKVLHQYYQSDAIHAKSIAILSNEKQCREEYDRDFRTIRLAIGNELHYELGDALEIFPHNDPEKVAEFLHAYSTDFDAYTVVKIHDFGIDGEVSLGMLFTHVLDLFGKPSQHFLQQLATFETDEAEKKTMLDPQFLKHASKATGLTIADALLRFQKAHPPLPVLLAIIPPMKPRAYSIASAPSVNATIIELLVLIDTWWCEEKGMRYGLNCDMLRRLQSGDHVWCRVHPGSMEAPTLDQPVLCAGIGSGLAPHMAFLRDRVHQAEQVVAAVAAAVADQRGSSNDATTNPTVRPFSLFFGNRNQADEYLYRSELEGYKAKYGKDWFQLHVAFSRDDPTKKVYVQDLVAQTPDARLLLQETSNGMMYVCGNRNLPKPLQNALIQSFSHQSFFSSFSSSCSMEVEKAASVAAAAAVENLYLKGRIQQEVW
jgi:pyruvate dehydrogenase (NADP+)